MLNATTLQRLARNPDDHQHEDDDHYCLDCILFDLLRCDFRVDLAMLATIDLEKLARLRAGGDGSAWLEHMDTILDPVQLEADAGSRNGQRRKLARQAQRTISDFLFYRRAARCETVITDVLNILRDIQRRTWQRLAVLKRRGEPALNPNYEAFVGGFVN